MNKSDVMNKLLTAVAVLSTAALTSCGLFGGSNSKYDGELVGVQDRKGWDQYLPYGMVSCPGGTFHMGQSDEDVPATQINMNKQVTIGGFYMDDTEITNNEYRQYIETLLNDSVDVYGLERIMNEFYPDTTVWVRDFTHHMGDPMLEYYYQHPAFDDYPVVGVSWTAAQNFCEWRTGHLNQAREEQGLFPMPNFRLPSEAEWEYAARGGRDLAPYPWGGPYIRNAKGCMLANFKPGRGNYYDDGFSYTSPVGAYFANDYGLYDMSGNISEWCEDAFYEASMPVVWDLNPTYFDENEPRKVVRGGSWKDIGYYLQTGTRTYEYEDSAKAYIGFRCAVTALGRSSGNEF